MNQERDVIIIKICAPMLRDMISRGRAVEMCRETWDQALESEAVRDLLVSLNSILLCGFDRDKENVKYCKQVARDAISSFTKAKGG